uniref:Uncharacterized protein n=1 Tax=Rhizophagus irregularis (strain DAOM 181602 / DAOM 197198 / MUCL 43194) TaxID=747089 RepID=U9TF66_RHIID
MRNIYANVSQPARNIVLRISGDQSHMTGLCYASINLHKLGSCQECFYFALALSSGNYIVRKVAQVYTS